jgi:acetyl-CoA/propionyl-CoA carboxylase
MNKKDLDNAKNPEDLKKQLTTEFNEKFANPYVAASNGSVDSVIDPAQTRPMLIKALEMLANKRDKQLPRKHGNINL